MACWSGVQSTRLNACETTRVPGFSSSSRRGRRRMFTSGSRYMVTTVASPILVSNRFSCRNVTLSSTPAFLAFSLASRTRCGSISTPSARAPFSPAAMAMRPSPEPRSITKSPGLTSTICSMRSTTSGGVGTKGTSSDGPSCAIAPAEKAASAPASSARAAVRALWTGRMHRHWLSPGDLDEGTVAGSAPAPAQRLRRAQAALVSASSAASRRPRALFASTSVMRCMAPRSSSFSTTAISRPMRSSAASYSWRSE